MHKVAAAPFADAHISARVFVERGSVEMLETVAVNSKMHRDEIKQYTDSRSVASVDEDTQLLGRAVACGRSKESGRLISPRAVTRIFGNRQELKIVVAAFGEIRNEQLCKLGVIIQSAVRLASECGGVKLVDIYRTVSALSNTCITRGAVCVRYTGMGM